MQRLSTRSDPVQYQIFGTRIVTFLNGDWIWISGDRCRSLCDLLGLARFQVWQIQG
jgi:hypothetical protein